jgi:hypothetical protein
MNFSRPIYISCVPAYTVDKGYIKPPLIVDMEGTTVDNFLAVHRVTGFEIFDIAYK